MEVNPDNERQVQRGASKVFGIGLTRTGTKSLTYALYRLGMRTVHFPDDPTTLQELMSGTYNFSVLSQWDGITDITVSAYYPHLDRLYPNSKFILTVRNKQEWLDSLEPYWRERAAFSDSPVESPEREVQMKLRRFLRATVYGCYDFNRDRLSYVYDLHYQNVVNYFRDRPQSLLILDICGGEGWEKLCTFFNQPLISEPFPKVLQEKIVKDLVDYPSPIPPPRVMSAIAEPTA
ncbi:sulfotransferase family protein [Roseofilum capinflatum]|uniref:Sulfotransferase family protein n=1 Tax=Roseofilum capinflatum BLCC-M114 TaxID=3022440 RepID=A0ABT7BCE3_9CYAN|nr:sulfotransferase family protein [Roseofilum capinflatum]MDJ1176862.1 hypothetical protein [Roseofilum capinflatum BLCC-M114]